MLYIVSTPIGNLGDITFRAVDVLKSVDMIACEDTRHTRILTQHYGIKTPLTSYYEYNKAAKGDYLVRLLKEGKTVALVSDAGTPGISDPGFSLIRDVLAAGIRVVSIPGATALVSALSISGFPTDRFFFEGFLPVKSGARRRKLQGLKDYDGTVVIYESPHRIQKTLEDMRVVLGDERPVALVREVTKKFEEVVRGDLESVLSRMGSSKPRGEFVIIF
jgi:16S rRNA (cytidine1402-2'-O)-methyltransferase